MHGVAHEAVFIYCECAATKQIGSPGGEKVAIIKIGFEGSSVWLANSPARNAGNG